MFPYLNKFVQIKPRLLRERIAFISINYFRHKALSQFATILSIYAYIAKNILIMILDSDNFSFQNNGIKKVHMLENNGFFGKTMGFLGKQCCFLKQCFYTISHMIYFDYKAYAFYQNKNYSCFT